MSDVNIWGGTGSGGATLNFPVTVAQGGTGATTASAARTALGLGTASVLDAGLGAGNVVALVYAGILPALDGRNLTNLPGVSVTSGTIAAALGYTPIAPGLITASGLTQNSGKLLGRSTTAVGSVEEITIGSGLSLSGGILTASGGGGGSSAGLNLYNQQTFGGF